MRYKINFFLVIGILLLVFSGCGPVQQITSRPATLAATVTATLISATEAPAPPIDSLHMIDANNGWAWTNSNRLLRTTDGGQTWMDRTPEGQVWSEGVFYVDAQTAWLPIFLQDSNRFGLLHTIDGGQTWAQYPYGPADGLHFMDSMNGWAAEETAGAGSVLFTLFETQDGGATWTPIPVIPPQPDSSLPPGAVHLCDMCNDSFYYDPIRMVIVHGDITEPGSQANGSDGFVRMQVSFDLGRTWQSQNLPLPKDDTDAVVAPGRLVFLDGKNGFLAVHLARLNSDGTYAYQRLAFYHTQDGGVSWSLLPGVLDQVAADQPSQIISLADIFVLCANTLCATHDGAQTWQPVPSNLDFSQTDKRSVSMLDFLDARNGWALIMENDINALYKTVDGGRTWAQITPLMVAAAPVTIIVDTSIPTPTLIPTDTLEPTSTPDVVFDQNADAYRIRFAPYATWVEINDTISANASKRYILSAMKGQIMSVSILQGSAFSLDVAGADKKPLSDSNSPHSFWRGALPSTQDYIVTVESQVTALLTLRITINPPGQETQNFSYTDSKYLVVLSYTDDFAPINGEVPIDNKGTTLAYALFH